MNLNIIRRFWNENWFLIIIVLIIIILTIFLRNRMDQGLPLIPERISIFPNAKYARYVRIDRNPEIDQALMLNLNEIQVYNHQNKLIDNNVRPSLSPQYADRNRFGPKYLVDNVLTSRLNNQWRLPHTHSSKDAFMELDLGKSHWIKRVKIVNRNDCCQDRITRARIVLLDKNRKELCSVPLNKIQKEYDINFTSNNCELSL